MLNILLSLAKEKANTSTTARSLHDKLLTTIHRQKKSKEKIKESCRRIKNAFKCMQEDYEHCKRFRFNEKYVRMQMIIREVTSLETQYWKLIDLPQPAGSESAEDYVNRVMDAIECSQAPPRKGIVSLFGNAFDCDTAITVSIYDYIKGLSTNELENERDQLYQELYRLIKKYLNLRAVLKDLSSRYNVLKFLPIFPRYILLKNLIKDSLRAPLFLEICLHSDSSITFDISP